MLCLAAAGEIAISHQQSFWETATSAAFLDCPRIPPTIAQLRDRPNHLRIVEKLGRGRGVRLECTPSRKQTLAAYSWKRLTSIWVRG